MDLWNDVSKKLGIAFDVTAKEAEKLSDIAKAKYKLISAQNKRESAFTAVGKLAYDEYKNKCDNKEAIDKILEQIDTLNNLIRDLNRRSLRFATRKHVFRAEKLSRSKTTSAPNAELFSRRLKMNPMKL